MVGAGRLLKRRGQVFPRSVFTQYHHFMGINANGPAAQAKDGRLYFASSDGGIEHSISQGDFERSLVYNLLFEPTDLLMSDISFFNSKYLISHVERTGWSLFERALSRGLIVPAFRSDVTSFRNSLEEIGIEAVLGIEESQFRTSPERFADRLDSAYVQGPQKRIMWPDDMGGSFGQLVTTVLQQSEPQAEDEQLAELWRDSTPWRIDSLARARRLTARKGGDGIRRAEVWNAAGQLLGVLGRDEKFDKPRDLVASFPTGSEIRAQVEQFVNTVNICYQRNQAVRFGAVHNIPSTLSRDAQLAVPNFALVRPAESSSSFEMEVMLPTASILLRADTGELLAIRESDPGKEYFTRRREWATHPSDDDEYELRKAIGKYVTELVNRAKGPQKRTLLGFVSQRGRALVDSAVGLTAGYGVSRLGVPSDFSFISGMISALASDTAISTLQLTVLKDGPYVRKERYPIIVESAPELNIPT